MENVFWIGLYPGLSMAALEYIVESLLALARGFEIRPA
jgi:hypothetical protein